MALPTIVFEAADDTVVRNDCIREMFAIANKHAEA